MRAGTIIKLGLLAGVALVGLSALTGSFYTVNQTERVVLTTNGAVDGIVGPGMHWKFPFIQGIKTFTVSQLDISNANDQQGMSVYTNDNQEIFVHAKILYTLPETEVLNTYEHITRDEDVLRDRVWSTAVKAIKTALGQVNTTTIAVDRDKVNTAVRKQVTDAVSDVLHVTVNDVQILNIEYGEAFKKGVEAAAMAKVRIEQSNQEKLQAEVDAKKVQVAAEGQANAVRAQADGAAYAKIAQAKADGEAVRIAGEAAAAARIATGLAEAKAIQAQVDALKANPDYVKLQIAKTWDGKLPTWNGGGPIPLLNLGPDNVPKPQ